MLGFSAISEGAVGEGVGLPPAPVIDPPPGPPESIRCLTLKVADHNIRNDDTGDNDRLFAEVLQPVLDLMCGEIKRFRDQDDVNIADSNTVNAMLAGLGNPFTSILSQPLNRRRLLVKLLVRIYRSKGTEPSLVDVIRAVTGIEVVQVISPPVLSFWILGESVLGDTEADPPPVDPVLTDLAILGASSQFLAYSFQIEVGQFLTDEQREIMTEVVRIVKPAHTHFLGFIEPGGATPVFDHWELGYSALHETGEALVGDEADLHGP